VFVPKVTSKGDFMVLSMASISAPRSNSVVSKTRKLVGLEAPTNTITVGKTWV
jgi:hypothetical protein